ncbi:MAG: TonB-dependent receptor plug domain-containing protein [Cytophagaceae bacterium]|nr:TonB-dependent receptor plug domain-containing protein [Gemmatimonadaceae bacterium]
MHTPAGAQARDTLRTRADSLRADSVARARLRADSIALARRDSLVSDSLMREDLEIIAQQAKRADSIKAPITRAESPVLTEHPGVLHWTREQIGSAGALTLGDLLEAIPGFTVFRSGWIGSPEQGAFLGDFRTVRVFYDGLEMDPLDPRAGGVPDLSFIQLWQLEDVRIERGATELRVYLRSWNVRSVTPSTRVDIGTGDLSTNAYRGYFGRRFSRGEVLQLGAYQYSTRDPRTIGDADQLSLFGRAGWAARGFSVDASFLRTRRERTEQLRAIERDNLPALDATLTNAYLRAGWVDTTRGMWAQLMAGSQALRQGRLIDSTAGTDTAAVDSSEIRLSRPQYLAAVGWSRRSLSLSATTRVRNINGTSFISPMLRGSWETSRLVLSGTAERRDEVELTRVEGSARLEPLPWIALSGAASRTSFDDKTLSGKPLAYRGEVAVRFRRMWAGVGYLSRDPVRLAAPVVFDTGFRAVGDSASATGTFVTARGKFWKDIGVDLAATKWGAERGFRPTYQARTRFYIDTSWPSRFPSGNLNILFAVTHDYRTQVPFLLDDGVILRSNQYRTLGMQLEIRLLQATLSYQFRNVLNEAYEQVPGFLAPRPVQFYGVRWNFFN